MHLFKKLTSSTTKKNFCTIISGKKVNLKIKKILATKESVGYKWVCQTNKSCKKPFSCLKTGNFFFKIIHVIKHWFFGLPSFSFFKFNNSFLQNSLKKENRLKCFYYGSSK